MDLDEITNPFHDVPGFDASFLRLIRPVQRKPRRKILNLAEDIPTPPSSSDEDVFTDKRPRKKKRLIKRK